MKDNSQLYGKLSAFFMSLFSTQYCNEPICWFHSCSSWVCFRLMLTLGRPGFRLSSNPSSLEMERHEKRQQDTLATQATCKKQENRRFTQLQPIKIVQGCCKACAFRLIRRHNPWFNPIISLSFV